MSLSSSAREHVPTALAVSPTPDTCSAKLHIVANAHEDADDPRRLIQDLARYREPSLSRSLFELAITFVPFIALVSAALIGVKAGHWAALLLTVPAGGFLLRLFLIQHDCGHGSYFKSRAANDWVGRILGVFTMTPYNCWRRSHALHHASTGNLEARGFGDVDTLTVREYHALPKWRRLFYRTYRHPFVLFGLGPAYLFLLRHRLPIGLMTAGRQYWYSAIGTNMGLAAFAALMISWSGFSPFLVVYVATVLVAASAGVWLFYVQHQFEQTHWAMASDWSFHHSAWHGSSHLALPGWLRWLTANIGVHHVHHLVSRIPCYRLGEVLRDRPELADVNRLTIAATLDTFRLALWDEDRRRMVAFRDIAAGKTAVHPSAANVA